MIFSRELFFYLSKNYSCIYTGLFENFKARFLKSIIKWSEMGQKTVQAKEVYCTLGWRETLRETVSGPRTKHTVRRDWNPDRSIRSPAHQPLGIDASRTVKGKVLYSNQKLAKIRFFSGLVSYQGFKIWDRRNLTLLLEANRREKLGQRSQCGRHAWLEPDELDWWTPFPVTRNSCWCHLMITSANNLKMNSRHKGQGWKLSSSTSCQSLVTIVGFFQLWPKGIKKKM